VHAMAATLQRVRALQATALGVSLDAPIRRGSDDGSPLGSLFAEALREAVPGADVAIVNNATRGLWADLPGGPLTFGRLYDVFPFDNRVRRLAISGAELGRWLASELQQGRRSGLGMSGIVARASCLGGEFHVDLVRADGRPVQDDDRLLAVTIGAPTLSGGLASADPLGSVERDVNAPVVREMVEDWFRRQGRVSRKQLDELTHRNQSAIDSPLAPCAARN